MYAHTPGSALASYGCHGFEFFTNTRKQGGKGEGGLQDVLILEG